MGRGGSRGGRGGGGGGGFRSSSGPKDLSNGELQKGCVAANGGLSSWGSGGSWWSSLNEKRDCQKLYILYNECVRLLDNKENDYRGCHRYLQEFEESCGKYKSLWSSWWTEKDEKRYCESWSRSYKRCLRYFSPEYCCGSEKFFRRACRGVELN